MTEHAIVTLGELRDIVWARCLGRCEHSLCGTALAPGWWECHHRQLRKHGGPDCACNAIALHPRCHTQGPIAVHDHPATSYDSGLLVRSWDNPEHTGLVLPRSLTLGVGMVLLSCGGTYV